MKKIEIIVGSNALNSLQKKFANAIKKEYSDKAEFEVLTLNDLPIFNYENENYDDEALKSFYNRLEKADGVIILAAEYNGSIHAVLKNALDWTSRGPQVLKGKPVFVTGATPSVLGTVRSQDHAKYILTSQYISASVLPGNQVLISDAYNKVDGDSNITDENTKKFLGSAIDEFLKWIDKLK